MSKDGWKFWIIPLGVWGLYCCWHFGYQSGYTDGHETAWKMYQPDPMVRQIALARATPESDDSQLETDGRR